MAYGDKIESASSDTVFAVSNINATLLAANADRKILQIRNDSKHDLFIKKGANASYTSYSEKIAPYATLKLSPCTYLGQIDGFWDVLLNDQAQGNAYISEIT